jgi:hypothetical protein
LLYEVALRVDWVKVQVFIEAISYLNRSAKAASPAAPFGPYYRHRVSGGITPTLQPSS